jgi:predicted metalloprotease
LEYNTAKNIFPNFFSICWESIQKKANQLTVRLELQADFLSGFWAHYAQEMLNTLEVGDVEEAMNATAAVGDDNLQMKYQGRIVSDAFTHGTSAQRIEWFLKGWTTGDIDKGNTFTANIN